MARATISTVSGIDNDQKPVDSDSGTDNASVGGNYSSESIADGSDNGFGTAPTSGGSDAGTDAYIATDAPIERKRKPRGTSERGRAAAKKTANLDLNKNSRALLAKKVVGCHQLLDAMFGVKGFFAISDQQGTQLTEAVMDVLDQYDMTVSPKVAAWCNLGAVAAMIYYPKYELLRQLKAQQAKQAMQNSPIQPVAPTDSNIGQMKFN